MDEVVSQKDRAFEALISLVEGAARPTDDQGVNMHEYGSEDEEYDGLCVRLVSEVEKDDGGSNVLMTSSTDPDQEMDTSIG